MPELPITNCIRQLRADNGNMSQLELARRIGVTRQTVNSIELGKYSPSLEVAFRIADVFDLPITQVFQYKKSAPREISPSTPSS